MIHTFSMCKDCGYIYICDDSSMHHASGLWKYLMVSPTVSVSFRLMRTLPSIAPLCAVAWSFLDRDADQNTKDNVSINGQPDLSTT